MRCSPCDINHMQLICGSAGCNPAAPAVEEFKLTNKSNGELLAHCVDSILQRIWPYQIADSRIHQIAQELRWLKADLSCGVDDLPEASQLWLFRVSHENKPRNIQEALELWSELRGICHTDRPRHSIDKYQLRLYLCGDRPISIHTLDNFAKLCDGLDAPCKYEIIDILSNPEMANKDEIIVTPTLIRVMPIPRRRILGDLDDLKTALLLIRTSAAPPSSEGLIHADHQPSPNPSGT